MRGTRNFLSATISFPSMPKADKSDSYSIAWLVIPLVVEHAHEHLHLSCGGGVYLRRLGVGNCRLNRGKRSFRANGREREESIADSDCCCRRHGKDLWPYRMTMEKEESEARERGETRETILFLESDSLGVRFARNATNARQNSELRFEKK